MNKGIIDICLSVAAGATCYEATTGAAGEREETRAPESGERTGETSP